MFKSVDLGFAMQQEGGHNDGGITTDVVIIGGGPAGLTAAYELQKKSNLYRPIVLEAGNIVGGIARTESHNGYRFDIGGHRFFTKVKDVEDMWRELMGDEFITVPRKSRIYYRGRFFDYPLKIFNALTNVGVYESVRIVVSYLKWRIRPHSVEESFEEWVMNRFGGRLYMHFFRSYTEKVWGISGKEITADWAAQRIKNLSLIKAVWNAISGANDTVSLIEEFQYPRLGPGQMWERCAAAITDEGGSVRMKTEAVKLRREGMRVVAVDVVDEFGTVFTIATPYVINSMALRDLIAAFDPPPPEHVRHAAEVLRYRDFLIVTLVLARPDPFPDNWIYIHAPSVAVGRIQNFRAWSKDMVPDPATASIGMEYFCQEGDALWMMSDADLRALATRELVALGLAEAHEIIDAAIIRQPKAYPVYDSDYKEALDTLAAWINDLENFQTVGRNGLHRYNNQDHSMLSAMYAARNILGEDFDVWDVNVDSSYHEELEPERPQPQPSKATGRRSTERMTPRERVSA